MENDDNEQGGLTTISLEKHMLHLSNTQDTVIVVVVGARNIGYCAVSNNRACI